MKISALHKFLCLIGCFTIAIMLAPCASWGQTRLNNFVIAFPEAGHRVDREFEFTLAEPSWVLIRTSAEDGCTLMLDDNVRPLPDRIVSSVNHLEAMQYLPAGLHKITAQGELKQLEVRRVPEIRYCRFQYDPWVHEEGSFDWAYLEEHITPHVNTIVGTPGQNQKIFADSWRARGGRWLVETLAPGIEGTNDSLRPQDIAQRLENESHLGETWIDGVLVDEYLPHMHDIFQPTVEAVGILKQQKNLSAKNVDAYISGPARKFQEFVPGLLNEGASFSLECYFHEQPTEAEFTDYVKKELIEPVRAFRELYPESVRHMTLAIGIMSTPPESLDVDPSVNFHVFLDRVFRVLATDGTFKDLGGIMTYTSGYADKSTLEWVGKLYRHYCLEGRTEALSRDSYRLSHIVNPDFADGNDGWNLKPANDASIKVEQVRKLGDRQGRYTGRHAVGDSCLTMTRGKDTPNVATQTIKNLIPGKLYELKMISTRLNQYEAKYGNPVFDDFRTVTIEIEGVELVEDQCYDHHYRSIHTTDVEFFTYHVRRFQAVKELAGLTISDWSSDNTRLGNVGQKIAVNFVQVSPRISDD